MFDDIKYETSASAAVAYVTGSAYLRAPKRIYAASHYQNFTGSVLSRTDLEFGRVSAWLDHIPNSSIREHNKDILNDAELQKKIKKIESELIVGRVLARASGTENVIRIMVESESKETAEKYVRDISSFFENESYS